MIIKKKLTKEELKKLSTLLRGQANAIAKKAGVSVWTVYSTFQNRFQNKEVLRVANEMIKEKMQETDENVEEIRQSLGTLK